MLECDQCLNGAQHICENMQLFGLHIDGCFAEWVVVPEKCARKIPDVLSDKVGAIMEPLGVGVHAAQVANVKGKKCSDFRSRSHWYFRSLCKSSTWCKISRY